MHASSSRNCTFRRIDIFKVGLLLALEGSPFHRVAFLPLALSLFLVLFLFLIRALPFPLDDFVSSLKPFAGWSALSLTNGRPANEFISRRRPSKVSILFVIDFLFFDEDIVDGQIKKAVLDRRLFTRFLRVRANGGMSALSSEFLVVSKAPLMWLTSRCLGAGWKKGEREKRERSKKQEGGAKSVFYRDARRR